VGRLLQQIPVVDRSVVSTDDDAIVREAQRSGLQAPFRRPASLSGDLIGDHQVLQHALSTMESMDSTRYDVVLMLQPTSPLRRPAHVMAVLEKLVAESWDAVWTVSPTDLKYHPLKQLTVSENGFMDYYDPAAADIIARQQLTPVYHRNGAAYAFTRECLLEQRTIRGARTGAVVIEDPLISIDTLEDFRLAEQMLTK
jgi:CMP-N-acetylneuraminic acid synthetase